MNRALAKRIQTLLPSPTVILDTKAKALKQQGINIVNLTAGEPDMDTPDNIKKAAISAIEKGFTKYTAPQGIIELRTAIAEKLKKDNNISYDPSQIVVGNGAKQVLYSIFQVLCDKDDEVIIPVPAWNTFIEQTKLAGGKPVLVKLQPPFKLTFEKIKNALTPKTKIILLNTPSNPTGAMINEAELKKIADLVVEKNLWVISDEIYEKLVYLGKHKSIASLNNQIKERTITVSGASKSYSMTGWRIGYAAGPKEVSNAMTSLQGQMASNVSSISQRALLAALTEDQTTVEVMKNEFSKRRKYLINEFSKIDELFFTEPEGAFYFYISVEKLLGKKYKTSNDWCSALLEKEKIAVVPGEAFYYPGYFRLSFAASMKNLKKAVEGIKKFIYET